MRIKSVVWGARIPMKGCYLTALPRQAMRALAGFGQDQQSFYLAQDEVKPPVEQLPLVFPELQTQLDRMESGENEANLAAESFLNLLAFLSLVILQDAMLLKKSFPNHLLWKHSLFKSLLFQEFEERLLTAMETSEEPRNILLERAMPILADKIDVAAKGLSGQISNLTQLVDDSVLDFSKQFNDLASGNAKVAFSIDFRNSRIKLDSELKDHNQAFRATIVPPDQAESIITSANLVSKSTTQSPSYSLSRVITTLGELWKEWTLSLNRSPSVVELDCEYGTAWRSAPEGRQFYGRRKVLIAKVKQTAIESGIDVESAVLIVERLRITAGKSLDGYSKLLLQTQ